ncbi:MAG: FGGY family carbohydrate kinase, partial [Anaerolineae bacterium]|nr:FGGY family carbohydrate kinase [Anaerolineae bacterium]
MWCRLRSRPAQAWYSPEVAIAVSAVLIGVDIGTSSTKAVALSPDGDVLGLAAHDTPVDTPHPGWAEQVPEAWLRATLATMRAAVAAAGVAPEAVQAIGLAGQMHGTVAVGSAGVPLRPAVIWADQRSSVQVEHVLTTLGDERLAAWTGNPVATGFMLPTWLWLRDCEPGVVDATRWLLLPKDYVRYRLTGAVGTEPSDAGSTSLFDPLRRLWSAPLLEALELDGGPLPPIYNSCDVAGTLLPEMAKAAGLVPGIPIIFGGSDQAMQALGNGVVAPGVVSSTIGTGGQLFAPTSLPVVDAPRLRMHSYCHVLPGTWHVESAMLSAGLSLR